MSNGNEEAKRKLYPLMAEVLIPLAGVFGVWLTDVLTDVIVVKYFLVLIMTIAALLCPFGAVRMATWMFPGIWKSGKILLGLTVFIALILLFGVLPGGRLGTFNANVFEQEISQRLSKLPIEVFGRFEGTKIKRTEPFNVRISGASIELYVAIEFSNEVKPSFFDRNYQGYVLLLGDFTGGSSDLQIRTLRIKDYRIMGNGNWASYCAAWFEGPFISVKLTKEFSKHFEEELKK